MSARTLPSLRVGEVFAVPAAHGGWGFCQVLRIKAPIEVIALDGWSKDTPTLDDAPATPRWQRAWEAAARLDRHEVLDAVPGDYLSLGVRDPVAPATARPLFAGSWDHFREGPVRERRWAALPAEVRDDFLRTGSPRPVTLTLGATRWPTHHRQHTLALSFGDSPDDGVCLDAGAPDAFSWSSLDALPCLRQLRVRGEAPGLIAWLATRPTVTDLSWEGFSSSSVDLRDTHLTRCALRGAALRELALPAEVDALDVAPREGAPLRIESPRGGASLSLKVSCRTAEDFASWTGLDDVSSVRVEGFSGLDAAALSRFVHARALGLVGAPGRLRSCEALASLRALQSLHLQGCVAIDVDRMPPLTTWGMLREVQVSGSRRADATALKARWKRDPRVHITRSVPDDATPADEGSTRTGR